MASKNPKKWIKDAVKPQDKGKLHEALHVKQGEKIPAAKLNKALHSSNPKLRREANLAKTLKELPHRHK